MFSFAGNVAHAAGGILKDLKSSSKGQTTTTYKSTLYLKKTGLLDVTNVGASIMDNVFELLGKGVEIKLISTTALDPSIGTGKTSRPGKFKPWILGIGLLSESEVKYRVKFDVEPEFGLPGAFTIRNKHPNEFYLLRLVLELPGGRNIEFPCNSWVYPGSSYRYDRIFFSNELFLPSDTPPGLVEARKTDLKALQGDGTGARVHSDRIYDYDVYNDLGSERPALGGNDAFPYPRRCRTGRRVVNGAENRNILPVVQRFYLPSDEIFAPNKNSDFLGGAVKAGLHSLVPTLAALIPFNENFCSFKEVEGRYDQGFDISKLLTVPLQSLGISSPLEIVKPLIGTSQNKSLLKFPLPQVIEADKRAWMSDEEFGRQMLSGVNPLMIQCLREFPPATSLDEEHLSPVLGSMTVQEAMRQKRLFIVDFYDHFMPFVEKINSLPDIFVYASRTLLFLKSDGTLQPAAIELSTPGTQRVFTPPNFGTDWLWELAKAHAASNDAVYHQLVSHWLRTHCCIEPFIIATQRQLSALHPLNPFLRPHFKNTMQINALARQILIEADGIIETCFSPHQYSIEISSAAYREWNFFEEGLPSDLIKRGMATPDPGSKHGIKLTIEDYPYAADGLEIWTALKNWCHDYVNLVYKDDNKVAADDELQSWWYEIKNFGHADKKDEPWWGFLNTREKLCEVLTIIIWLGSAHHAAVNFGQYAYSGYFPNHPTKTRKPIPELDSPEHKKLLQNPEAWFLSAITSKSDATKVMLTLELLSSHADDEEYLGQRSITNWTSNEKALSAFRTFTQHLNSVDDIITNRNKDPKLKNRRGPVQVPYTLLYSTSSQGLTGRGVPNSISI